MMAISTKNRMLISGKPAIYLRKDYWVLKLARRRIWQKMKLTGIFQSNGSNYLDLFIILGVQE